MNDIIKVGDSVLVIRTGEVGVVTNVLTGTTLGDIEVWVSDYTVCVPSEDLEVSK